MNIMEIITGNNPQHLNWSSASALWNIARFKIIGLPIMDYYVDKANDPELKAMLLAGIETTLIPHAEKIQKLLINKGLEAPSLYQRGKIDDEQIARCVREIIKHGIVLDTLGLIISSEDDVRNLISKILSEDQLQLNGIIGYKKRKGILFEPPTI